MTRRFIEVDFPIGPVSEASVREKNIRRGHISGLHIWWARRPLAVSRASIYAALIPEPCDEEARLKKAQFIADLCQWENSLNPRLIEKARREILEANGGKPPRVLDCFAGGGAIPLEALRLGCETYALELNPVAVLILKATLEYPQKYGDPEVVRRLRPARKEEPSGGQLVLTEGASEGPTLVDDVRYWGQWVLEEARKQLAEFYAKDPDGSIPVACLWARTVRCQNPDCGAEIPLMRQFWLARKKNKRIALRPVVDREDNRVRFEIVEGEDVDFDPGAGTVRRANVACPVCGAGMKADTLRREFQEGRVGERMVAVVLHHPSRRGKTYRIATDEDMAVFRSAEAALREKMAAWPWDFPPVPDEATPAGGGSGAARAFSLQRYGLLRWGELFNPRQQLALTTFVEKVRRGHEEMLTQGYDCEYGKAVATYLAIVVDRMADFESVTCRWHPQWEFIPNTFARQALPMSWDYAELNLFSPILTGTFASMHRQVLRVLDDCLKVDARSAQVSQGTATRLPHPHDHFDAVITDPPYYDNVPYADLSDFFYVWLKRSVGHLHPDLFATPLTPKSQEIIEDETRHGGDREKGRQFFEEMLTESFKEINRVLKPEGIAVIVFAHKSLDAWETVIQSLLRSGLVLNASWPVHTEMKGRLRGQESAALASSVYMVCRKRVEEKIAYLNEIRPDIEQRIRAKLKQFWNEGIGGADFFISAIGPAVEVFGQYSRVERLSGEEVTVKELLQHVRRTVVRFALERILKSPQTGDVDNETLFYLLWRWTYNNARAPFDDARKLGQAVGVEVTEHWGRGGFIKKEKEYIRVLGPRAREKHLLEGRDADSLGPSAMMIDVLHRCLLLWQRSDRKAIGEVLMATGYGAKDIFWQVAQAISEVLPEGDKERQLLQGFLYGRQQYEAAAKVEQRTLFDMNEEVGE